MRSGLLFAVTLPALLAFPFLSGSAAAQTSKDAAAQKLACVQASDKAQQLRVAGKLVAARDTLRTCVVDACPTVIREACSQWLGEVTSSLPSIVIGAKDGDGKDILDIKVSIDGTLVTEHLGGRALPIDPGRHKMRYEAADGAVLEEDILVGEGTKNRQVAVQFPSAAKPSAATVPGATTEAALGPKGASTGNTIAGTVFAVVGAGALGTALALDLSTTSSVNADKAPGGCATKPGGCSASTVNGYQVDYDVAGVAVGVGIVAVGVALYVLIAHPFGERHPAAIEAQKTASHEAGPTFRVVPSPHGSGFALSF